MSVNFKLRYLSLAVLSSLSTLAIAAETTSTQPSQATVLDEIVVSERQGNKIQTNLVTTREMDESTATDMRGLLSKESSIDFSGGNGSSQFLTIRGMGQNSVDIKIDNAYSDSQILYHQGRFIVDPSLLKSISVQKGAGAASAGIGATNGAIIAKTVDALDLLKNTDKPYGFKLNTGYNSNNGISYGATVFGQYGNFDALFSYNRVDDQDYKAGKDFVNWEGKNLVPYSGLDKRNYLLKFGATFGDHRIVLSHLQDQQRGIRLVREEFALNSDRLTLTRQAPAYRVTTLQNTNLEYTATNLGFISKLTANAYFMKNERYSANDSGCGYCGNIAGPTTTVINTRGANINLDSPIGEHSLLKYGLNYRYQDIKPDRYLNEYYPYQKSNKTDIGAYVESINYLGDFTLTAGLRYDYFDAQGTYGKSVSHGKLNPSFNVIYEPIENLSFSLTHNYATRSPRLYDALLTHGKRGVVAIAENTVAERARNTELGFNYKYQGFTVSASYFWQKINDAIINPVSRHVLKDSNGKDITPSRISYTENVGYVKNHGYEINLAYQYEGWNAYFGVSHSKPRFYTSISSPNVEFGAPVGTTLTTGLSYRFNNPNLELGWKSRIVKGTNTSIFVGESPVKRPGYGVHDIYLNWKPLTNDSMNINVAVNNLFNKFYYPHSQRGQTLPGAGRSLTFGMNYTF